MRDLDQALLRPGRFDYVIPIGPPDAVARASLWRRFTTSITDATISIDELVEGTDLFTTADIEFAARKAAQAAFERAVASNGHSPAQTQDFVDAVAATRPTLTRAMIREFEEDIDRFERM